MSSNIRIISLLLATIMVGSVFASIGIVTKDTRALGAMEQVQVNAAPPAAPGSLISGQA